MFHSEFPILAQNINNKRLIYFDSACTSLKPIATVDGSILYYTTYGSCAGDRESSLLGGKLYEEIQMTRRQIRGMIGAKEEDYIVFTASATDAINLLVHSLADTIQTFIVSDLEHNSNYLPQYELSKNNSKNFLILPYQDILDINILDTYLQNIKHPFLLSFTHASNIIGGKFDIAAIADCVHKNGGYILVDDTQFIAHNNEQMHENHIDFLAFSAHKMYGPTGIGILAIKHSSSHIIQHSTRLGGGTIRTLEGHNPLYKGLPYVLEGGVQNFSGILGILAAIEWRNQKGIHNMYSHVTSLVSYFHERLSNDFHDEFLVVSLQNSSLVTLVPKNFQSIDFHQYCNHFLADYILSFRTGTLCSDIFVQQYLESTKNILRFSFGVYNTKEEIDILFSVLKDYIGLLRK